MSNETRIPMIPSYRVISRVQILAETLDYNHKLMNVPAMWRDTRGDVEDGEPVRVAILDTGRPNHIDLEPTGSKSFIDGYDEDKNGHSTHCGGILAAKAENGMGVAGIAPDCDHYYGAVLDGNGSGSIPDIVKGIYWAVDDIGAKIISMSLGIRAGFPNFEDMEKACNYAASQGVAVICAAGNESSAVGQPACYDSTIAVAAVDSRNQHASFSNIGPEVDFAAGGVQVYSTYLGNGYAKLSGTSMACPAFAGIATLILADEKQDHDRWLTPDELREKIRKICFDVGPEGFDEVYGHGIPFFRSGEGEPDEPGTAPAPDPVDPPAPPPPPSGKKSGFPCEMAWKAAQLFADAGIEATKGGADSDGAMLSGLDALGKFASKAIVARKS